MQTVYKFPLVVGPQRVLMAVDGEILAFQHQGGQLVMWALVNQSSPQRQRFIEVIGTGWEIEDHAPGRTRRYIGTVQMPDGLVWHAFEQC